MNFGTKKNRLLESFLSHETVSSRILLLFMFFVSIDFNEYHLNNTFFFIRNPLFCLNLNCLNVMLEITINTNNKRHLLNNGD